MCVTRSERLTSGGKVRVRRVIFAFSRRVVCRRAGERCGVYLRRLNADAIFPAFAGAPQRPRRVFARAVLKAFRTPESLGAAPISEDARQCPIQSAIPPFRAEGP